jgi:hypothetical protein
VGSGGRPDGGIVPGTGGVKGTGGGAGTGGSAGVGGALGVGGLDSGSPLGVDAGAVALDTSIGSGGSGGSDGTVVDASLPGTDEGSADGAVVGSAVDGAASLDGADGGGDSPVGLDILAVFPRAGTVAGWTIDPTSSVTKGQVAAIARTQTEAESLIDGAAADFFAAPFTPVAFGWQNYANSTLPGAPGPNFAKVSLYILQMPEAAQASGRYASLLATPLYGAWTWSEPGAPLLGTDSRIADTGDSWWINFYKGDFYVEVRLSPSYGPPPDYTPGNASTRAAAMTFTQAVASKL